MPKCLNDKTKTYKGDGIFRKLQTPAAPHPGQALLGAAEPSPKGLGISASAEEDGKIMQGKDNNLWKVKLISNGQKRWSKVKDEIPKKENTVANNTSTMHSEKPVTKEEEEEKKIGIICSFVAPTTFGKSSGSASDQALLGPTKPTIRQASFHNIVDEIFPHYQRTGCIGLKNDKYNEEIEKYISENTDIKCGDILFVGPNSVSLPRDEDGFCIILNAKAILKHLLELRVHF